ncbi:MAG: hypothetical protein MJ025_05040 [Victivallaceae bacterium]|nr:hypothetical protein [Victivallaceae bacterium]
MRRLLMLFCVVSAMVCAGGETLDAFLTRVRAGNGTESFSRMTGTLQHRRRGGKPVTLPIYFGVIIRSTRCLGQLILDDREYYDMSQSLGTYASSMTPRSSSTELLDGVGILASDLLVNFIYYPPLRELPGRTLSGVVPCRVVEFSVPESTDRVVGFIAEQYHFPLRAEYYHVGENKPFRILEANAFGSSGDLYYPKRLTVEGPGWRTRIDFDDVVVGHLKTGVPPDVFRPVPSKAEKDNQSK